MQQSSGGKGWRIEVEAVPVFQSLPRGLPSDSREGFGRWALCVGGGYRLLLQMISTHGDINLAGEALITWVVNVR